MFGVFISKKLFHLKWNKEILTQKVTATGLHIIDLVYQWQICQTAANPITVELNVVYGWRNRNCSKPAVHSWLLPQWPCRTLQWATCWGRCGLEPKPHAHLCAPERPADVPCADQNTVVAPLLPTSLSQEISASSSTCHVVGISPSLPPEQFSLVPLRQSGSGGKDVWDKAPGLFHQEDQFLQRRKESEDFLPLLEWCSSLLRFIWKAKAMAILVT